MSESLYENLDKLEDEELLYKISNGMLTDAAHAVALKVLHSRGIEVNSTEQVLSDKISRTYGLASDAEKEVSTNTLLNFFLVLTLPLIQLAVMGAGSHYATKVGFFEGIAIALVSLVTSGVTLKISYRQLFRKEDKLSSGVKATVFGTSLLITAAFTLILIFSIFNK
jgi:hypothetical protein